MADQQHTNTPAQGPDMVAELIRSAGRREAPPEHIYQRVHAATREAYTLKIQRKQRHRIWMSAVAASLLAAVASLFFMQSAAPPMDRQIAQLLRATGTVEVMRPDAQAAWKVIGSAASLDFPQGTRLRTGSTALAALVVGDAVTVRIADHSDMTIISPAHIALHKGRIYIDSGDDESVQMAVTTPAGVARDIGTQFEVQYLDRQLRLRIRDGRVELSRDTGQLDITAGEQLSVNDKGTVSRAVIAPDAADWQWIEQIAFAPDIDGQPVRVLLDWVARETGKTLRFSDSRVETDAATTLLHGDVSLLRPMQALSVMLATTDFGFAVGANGEIEVWSKARQ